MLMRQTDEAVADAPAATVTGRLRQLLTDTQSLNLAAREKAALVAALDQCNGNKKKAAELLGIHRPTLYTKLKKFGLEV